MAGNEWPNGQTGAGLAYLRDARPPVEKILALEAIVQRVEQTNKRLSSGLEMARQCADLLLGEVPQTQSLQESKASSVGRIGSLSDQVARTDAIATELLAVIDRIREI